MIPTEIRRILIVRLSALGDTALTLPLARLIRQRRPELELGWVVGERAAPLLRGWEEIDRLHVLGDAQRHPAGLWRLAKAIGRRGYQLSLDPQGLTLSALIPWLAGIPLRAGFAPGPLESRELAPLLLNRRITVPAGITHIAERTLQLAGVLGIGDIGLPSLRFPRYPQAAESVADWWRRQGLGADVLVMGLGAGWPTKIWSADKAFALARASRRKGWRVVLLWGPAEEGRLADWRAAFGNDAIMAPPTDIAAMVELLRNCQAYAGPDSAALHLAWLLGRPTFSWFGASDPARCAPIGKGHRHVAGGPHDWRRRAWFGNPLDRLQAGQVLPAFESWLDIARDQGPLRTASAVPAVYPAL